MRSRKSFIYFLISIFLSISLISIKKTITFQIFKESTNIRNLVLDNARTYSCNEAESRLINKYKGGFNEETGDAKESLNDAQQSIVDFIRHSSYNNIKPYLKRVAIYITFLCIAVIFIILWITYCSCCCCNCCLFSKVDERNKTFQLILFLISVGCCLLVIIFSIVVLSLINPFFSRLNGLFCSILTLLNHLNDGLSPQYPPHSNEWLGLSGTVIKFNESEQEFQKIDFDKIDNLYEEVSDKCIEPEANCVCNAPGIDIDLEYYSFSFFIRGIFVSLGLPKHIANLLESKKIIDDTIIDIGEDIYDFLHDYGNRHIKNICIAIFVLTLIFGILSLVFLCLYYFLKKEKFRIVYIFIWNILMLIIILALIISAIYGIIGFVFKDFVQIVHYTLSINNLESDDPLIFKRKHSFLSGIIDECANGDGHFLDILGVKLSNLNDDIQKDIQQTLDILYNNTCMNETRDSIVEFYLELSNATNKILTIYADLFNISCSFAKNDKNIILNEMKSAGNRGIVISVFQFLIAIFIGISILFGILLVHKYNFKKQFPKLKDVNNYRNNVNNSNDNLNT